MLNKCDDFLKISILIICHFGHFLFSKLFLNAQYTLVAISWTTNVIPIDMRFYQSFICFDFLKLFKKNGQHSNVPGNVLHFFPLALIFGSIKCVFQNVHFKAPIESTGPGMVSSQYVKSPRSACGLDKHNFFLLICVQKCNFCAGTRLHACYFYKL